MQGPMLMSPARMRVLAGITLFLAIACLVALGAARERAPVRFERTVQEHSFSDVPAAAAVEWTAYTSGLVFLVLAAASRRVAQAMARRSASSFLMGLSPVHVILIIAPLLVLPQAIASSVLPGMAGIVAGIIGLVLAVVILSVMASKAGYSPQRAMGLSWPRQFLGGLAGGLGGWLMVKPMMLVCMAAVILVKFAAGLQIRTQTAVEQVMSYPDASFGAVAVGVVFAVPILEEISFRTFFYGSLRRRVGIPAAALVSGLVFALLHMSPDQLPALAVLGVVLALVYEKTQTIVAPIFLHMLVNAEGVLQIALLRAQGH